MKDIYLVGTVGVQITLNNLIEETKDVNQDDVINVYINTVGGSVYEGIAIYNYLKRLNVKTHTLGQVASIGTIIFLAGKERVLNESDGFFVHLPLVEAYGNAEKMQENANELRNIEQKLAGIYALETNLTIEESIQMMKEEKWLSKEFLFEKGFVNSINTFKAVATINNNHKMNKTTVTKEQVEGLFAKFENSIKKFLNITDFKNKIVFNANGVEVDFYELGEDEAITVGAKARIDGANANGEVVMAEGETYVFVDGELTEIKTAEGEDNSEELEALKTENEELKAKIQEFESQVSQKNEALNKVKAELKTFKAEIVGKFKAEKKINEKGNEGTETVRTLRAKK